MATREEEDYPVGHPARYDYDPHSAAAKEWLRINSHPKGERDFPVDHPKAVDTPGNTNHVAVLPGVDPERPEYEAFSGRNPQQAKAVAKLNAQRAKEARESIAPQPIEAPEPPPPGDISEPAGQPDTKPVRRSHTQHRKNK